jgi:hypothetical protein
MSDTAQGPGWWIASDEKWYPPELQPSARPAHPMPPAAGRGAEGLAFGAWPTTVSAGGPAPHSFRLGGYATRLLWICSGRCGTPTT